jgi:hypothetical protein
MYSVISQLQSSLAPLPSPVRICATGACMGAASASHHRK